MTEEPNLIELDNSRGRKVITLRYDECRVHACFQRGKLKLFNFRIRVFSGVFHSV